MVNFLRLCIIRNISTLHQYRSQLDHSLRVALVPTMGALHEGHLSLVRTAQNHADVVIVSIYVNPSQFGKNEDLSQYPRNLENDCKLLEQYGVDAVFTPDDSMIYPEGYQTWVTNDRMSQGLCGDARPGHFRGVCTVVLKLFNLIRPHIAVFGKKDYQQFKVIDQMVKDLHMPVEIIGSELIRDEDGLALSSRNAYLTPEQRQKALAMSSGMKLAREKYQQGCFKASELLEYARDHIERIGGLDIDYLELRRQEDLGVLDDLSADPGIMLAVVKMGPVRLLDNLEF